jgi:hypothetical protein
MATRAAQGINWTLVLGIAGAAAAVYLLSKASKVAGAAVDTVSTAIANDYIALTQGPPMQAAGSVDDQAGNVLGPIANFNSSHDAQGNTYLAINGYWYQLGPRDASGNFTAIPTGQAVSA